MGHNLELINVGSGLLVPMIISRVSRDEMQLHFKSLEKMKKYFIG